MYLGCCAIIKIYFIDKHIISPVIKYNIIQRAKSEINNTLLKDDDFHKYLLYHTTFFFHLKRKALHTLCCKKTFFLSCSKTHFENRRSYRYCKQYCSSRAENWWHISTQKPPNIGSSIAISV